MTSIAPYSRRGGFHIRPGAVPLPQTARAGSARPYRAPSCLPCSPHRQHRHRYVILLGPGAAGGGVLSAEYLCKLGYIPHKAF